jgi:glutamate/tyrosine decarboxylase-like PLP-dependent enzyme
MRLDVSALARSIRADREAGKKPFLVVGTAGTTATGSIDPLPEIGEVAASEGLWFHVDAAWGGAAAFVPELRGELEGIASADSITFDAHKWLSVPMCGSVLLTRRGGSLENAFAVATAYMPRDAEGVAVEDPYARSMQWSRRFTGLKLFLSLAVAGWSGYEVAIRRMVALGRELRERLEARGWRLVNDTPLPVVCFVDGRREDGDDGTYVASICQTAVRSGRAWISTIDTGGGKRALRACITNFETRAEHLGELVETLEMARRASSPRAI